MRDGWHEMTWPGGHGSDVVRVYTRFNGQFVQVGRAMPMHLEQYIEQGYTFAPLIALTPELVKSLHKVLSLANLGQGEFEIGDSPDIAFVEAMLNKLEGTDAN